MFGTHDDAKLNDALRAAGLFALEEAVSASSTHDGVKTNGQTRLTLDSPIASGGSNLSMGQRQIIALARAMVPESKLLILDEATSAFGKASPQLTTRYIFDALCKDYETDKIIQASLRRELPKDVTVIAVAHRLQTVLDCDKIVRSSA
jgi:ABC-type multidrug transport system fused ATPase/permease subunit